MRESINNSSIMIISHQERILNIADEIVVIRNGQLAAQGPRNMILPTLLNTDSAVDGYCFKQQGRAVKAAIEAEERAAGIMIDPVTGRAAIKSGLKA
jgi:ABC-type protease/lipase transport system fused ATPase/permease subunit